MVCTIFRALVNRRVPEVEVEHYFIEWYEHTRAVQLEDRFLINEQTNAHLFDTAMNELAEMMERLDINGEEEVVEWEEEEEEEEAEDFFGNWLRG